MKAMILAAGLGTRLRPLTDHLPKALVELNGIPLLERLIRRLRDHGFNDLIINVHHYADRIVEFLDSKHNFGITIQVSDETGKLLDTGGGLKHAAWFFDDGKPFLLHNVDIVTDMDLQQLYAAHQRSQALATLVVKHRQSSRYLLFNQDDFLCGWGNIVTGERKITRPSDEAALQPIAFSGIHVIRPTIFDLMPDQEVFSMTELYLQLAAQQQIAAFIADDLHWWDIGKLSQLRDAEQWLRAQGMQSLRSSR